MATKVVSFPDSTSRSQTKTVTIPGLKSVTSATVNTGSVSVTKVEGETVTLSLSNGAGRSVQTGGTYTPADTKPVSGDWTGSGSIDWKYSGSSWIYYYAYPPSPPDSAYYSSGGYVGTLTNRTYKGYTGTSPSYVGTEGEIANRPSDFIWTYTGDATKPASDTRTYTTYYQYEVTITYVDNTAPTTPGTISSPVAGTTLVQGANYSFVWGAASDPDGNVVTYYPEYSFNGGAWTALGGTTALNQNITIPSNAVSFAFRVRAYDGTVYSNYQTSSTYTVTTPNALPTLTLNTADAQTLYENNVFTIDGTATDTDSGNTIVVKYKINSGASETIKAQVSDGSTPVAFSKALTFKQGKLFDGTREVAVGLAVGVPHTLTVWSEDDKGGKSANVTRTFSVVPNRAPGLTIDTFTTVTAQINNDTVTISGTVTDPENENVTASYTLNGGPSVQIHNGPPGAWSFNLQVKNLQTGDNKVIIEAVDSYGVKTVKTINKLTKAPTAVPLKNAVAMWKIQPPTGSAIEVLSWIQRELGDLTLDAKVSMTNVGEQENFVPLTLTQTAPVNATVTEDEFHYLAAAAKTNIVLKLNLSRTDTASDLAIKLVSGVLE